LWIGDILPKFGGNFVKKNPAYEKNNNGMQPIASGSMK
jgi:hypothetical protein